MASRLQLHEELCEILVNKKAYFQPPTSVQMDYPCVRYNVSGMNHKRANDVLYTNTTRYEIIVIDYDPDSEIPNEILKRFPMCSFDRWYVADNLNHFVLSLYY